MSKLSRVLVLEDDPFWADFFSRICELNSIDVKKVSSLSGYETAIASTKKGGQFYDGLVFDLGLDIDAETSIRNLHARLDDWPIRTMVVTGLLDPHGLYARLAMTHHCVEHFLQKAYASDFDDHFKAFFGFASAPSFLSDVRRELVSGIVGNKPKEKLAAMDDRVTNTVFVIHGQDEKARRALFDFLRSIGLHPIEWTNAIQLTGDPAPFIRTVLETALARCGAVVALLTGDEMAQLRPELAKVHTAASGRKRYEQARPNVFIEIGMALASNPGKLILVEIGNSKVPSDISGMHVVRLSNSAESRTDLANRLSLCGCPVDILGTDWLKSGDLSRTD